MKSFSMEEKEKAKPKYWEMGQRIIKARDGAWYPTYVGETQARLSEESDLISNYKPACNIQGK